ncbi:MAG: Transcriptional regulator, TetR family [Rickettsiaceae bacterium]|jgi:TetR/AcrR family transcriptional repressor of mexJK operon|nr:Transcriptional regulator, TetR family [Rickettsiaceae bacterium]
MPQISKKEQILETAGQLFLQEGFRKVSMDAIAAAVPVSKPTLYNNFSDKKELFASVIAQRCQQFLGTIEQSIDESMEVKQVLETIAAKFLTLILSPEAIKINRIVTAECEEFPEMAELFYQSGPQKTLNFLEVYLQKQHTKGTLRIQNAKLSAEMFISMLKGQRHMQCMLGLRKEISDQELTETIDYSVQLFLQAHKVI